MMILGLGVLADAAYGVDAVEEGGELHGAFQGAVAAFPARQVRKGGVDLFVSQYGHVRALLTIEIIENRYQIRRYCVVAT